MDKTVLEKLLGKFRYVRRLERANRRLGDDVRRLEGEKAEMIAETAHWRKFVPPGHYYSPLPSLQDIADAFARGGSGRPLPAIDLREDEQVALAREFAGYYPEQPFPEEPAPGRRYHLNNPSYGHHDAVILYCMLRHLRPKRIVEVGSGFSTAAMLDINAFAMGGRMRHTVIDPDTSRLGPLLGAGDGPRVELIERRVQEVPLETFAELEANDVLFVDSSHVCKIGSDVSRLFFEVLPVLRPGVHVHIHDVTRDLEYPRGWLEEGRAWNEQYLLRAFLMYNRDFEIRFFSGWFLHYHRDFLRERMPICARGGGGQLWLRRGKGGGEPAGHGAPA